MLDISGKPLRNRAIVLLNSFDFGGLNWGVIDQIHEKSVDVILAFADSKGVVTFAREKTWAPEDYLLQVKNDQLPARLKDALIKISQFRTQ